jgi:hypothetical protein
MDISNTMDSARVYFRQKGFPESAITVKTPARKLGISQDIVKESYEGYHAVVVGRIGWSRFKDWLIKSTAMKTGGQNQAHSHRCGGAASPMRKTCWWPLTAPTGP